MQINNSKEALVAKALEFHKVKLNNCLSCVFDIAGAYELGHNEHARIESEIKQLRAERIDAALQALGVNTSFGSLTRWNCIEPEAFVQKVAQMLPDLSDEQLRQMQDNFRERPTHSGYYRTSCSG